MQLIQTVTVGSGGAANITFSSIPQTFTDLVLKLSLRVTNGNFPLTSLLPNGSSSNLTSRTLFGDGSNPASNTQTNGFVGNQGGSSTTANTFANCEVYIPNYTSSNPKSASADSVAENNATAGYQIITAFLWNDTSPITSITIDNGAETFAQYSSASLYGITKGSDGIVTVS